MERFSILPDQPEAAHLRATLDRIRARVEMQDAPAQSVSSTRNDRGERVERSPKREEPRLPCTVPTTTAHQGRIPLFAPVRRPRGATTRQHNTPWGSVRVDGRLGQAHADLIEAIWHGAFRIDRDQCGRIYMLVAPYKVRSFMSGGRNVYSHAMTWTLLRDLTAALVEIEIPARHITVRTLRHIVQSVDEISTEGRRGPAGRRQSLWRVTLGEVGEAFLLHDFPLRRPPLATVGIRHAVSQAIARHVLTHKQAPRGGWKIERLLDAVGVARDKGVRRNRRREIHSDTAAFGRLGVVVGRNRIDFTGPSGKRVVQASQRVAEASERVPQASCV